MKVFLSCRHSRRMGKCRGFASATAFSLAVIALALAASLVVQLGASRHSSTTALEAMRLGWRFNDSVNFLSSTASDAFVDASYQSCGCSADSASSVNSTLSSVNERYFANASQLLSDLFYSTRLDKPFVSSVSISSCNFSSTALFYVKLDVRSPNSARSENVSFTRTLNFSKTAPLVSFNISEGSRLLARMNVTCS